MNPILTEAQINEAIQSALSDYPDDATTAKLNSDAASYLFLAKVIMQRLPAASITDADVTNRLFLLFAEQRIKSMLAGDMTNPVAKLTAFMDIIEEGVEMGARLATSVHTQRPIAPNVSPVHPARPAFAVDIS